jgi:hypothetical protein
MPSEEEDRDTRGRGVGDRESDSTTGVEPALEEAPCFTPASNRLYAYPDGVPPAFR